MILREHFDDPLAVLVGRGDLASGGLTLTLVPMLGGGVGALAGVFFSLGDEDLRGVLVGAITLGTIFLLAGVVASINLALMWQISAARVRYYVSGGEIVVTRGNAVVARVAVDLCSEIHVMGDATTRNLIIGLGTFWTALSALPQVHCIFVDNGISVRSKTLPHILLVGRAKNEMFRRRLFDELLDQGTAPDILRK